MFYSIGKKLTICQVTLSSVHDRFTNVLDNKIEFEGEEKRKMKRRNRDKILSYSPK